MLSSLRYFRILLFLLIVSFMIPAPGLATWSTDPAVNNPVTEAVDDQFFYQYQVAPDGSGGVIVVWDHFDENGPVGIYAQRLNASGDRVWSPADGIPIALGTASKPFGGSQVVSDYHGGAFVTWVETDYSQYTNDIYAQRIDAGGNLLWGPTGMPVCTADSMQSLHRILSIDNPGLLVLYTDERNNTGVDVYFQWLDGNGNPQFVTDGIPVCTAFGDQLLPNMTVVGDSGVVVAWQDERYYNSLGLIRVYAQRIWETGTMWTTDGVGVNANTRFQRHPLVVSNGDDYAIVVWEAYGSPTAQNAVYAQKLEPISGVGVWNPQSVQLTDTTVYCSLPTALADGHGGVYVAWKDRRLHSGDLFAQRLAWDGSEMWDHYGVPVQSGGYRSSGYTPMVQSFNRDVIILWRDERDYSTNGYDIYGQRIGADGTPRWTVDGIPLSTGAAHQHYVQAVTDGSGGVIAVWRDERNAYGIRPDIFTQHMSWTGALGVATGAGNKEASVPPSLSLEQNNPNPFGEATRFRYVLSTDTDVRVEVYNIAGQRVAAHLHPQVSSGTHTFRLEARDDRGVPLPSGVYFYRVTAGGLSQTKKMVVLR
jgi:hypothetical protein